MRNTLAFVAAVALAVAGAGWYLGWYQIRTTTAHSGHQSVSIDINTDKVGEDLHKGSDEVLHQGREKIEELLDKKIDTGLGTAKKDGTDRSGTSILSPRGLLEESEPPARFDGQVPFDGPAPSRH